MTADDDDRPVGEPLFEHDDDDDDDSDGERLSRPLWSDDDDDDEWDDWDDTEDEDVFLWPTPSLSWLILPLIGTGASAPI